MKRLREENGWSQGEMARRMTEAGWPGFHQTTISRMEKGERPVRLGEARAIAQIFGALVGQMILPTTAAKATRELELQLDSTRNARMALSAALHAFEVEKQALRLQLMDWRDQVDLGEVVDGDIRARAETVLAASEREAGTSISDVVNDFYEFEADQQESWPNGFDQETP